MVLKALIEDEFHPLSLMDKALVHSEACQAPIFEVVGINRISDLGGFSLLVEDTEKTLSTDNSQTNGLPRGSVVEFSMNGLSDGKGMKLVEKAERKMVGTNSCWQNAYQNLFAGCSQILAVEEKRWRFAWHLSDCFQKDSGRPAFPYCDTKSAMVNCLKRLNDNEHKKLTRIFLCAIAYRAHAFNHKMERLVNDLKNSAEYTEEQLEIIGGKTHVLLQRSNQIQDSLSSIDIQVENVAQTTKDAKDHMDVLSKHSEAVYKHSKEIAQSQSELQEGQAKMNENLKEGMSMLHDAYTNLGQEVDNVRNEAVEIEKQIGRVGDTMSSKTKLLSTLQHFAEYGHKQQEELLQQQEQLQKVHGHLVVNSNSILAAQEAFESKQASMFIALEKLFALHNAMLLESRIIKAFILYTASIFIVYMFTSTKQTYTIRARLYVGLVATFLVEVATLRLTTNSIERQTWLINVFRLLYGILASIQFLHAIFTYRDYEVLNHHLILNVMDKINVMQKTRELSWETDSDVDWSSWIQTELAEGGDNLEDPDFMVPEEVAENSIKNAERIGELKFPMIVVARAEKNCISHRLSRRRSRKGARITKSRGCEQEMVL
ncbi:protein GAMETE EXPRESSED 1 [Populus alba]|uniref:protein GAMETE EXPRESSED 1 n=1 Tax=Populus alba TaxID=43335 RepID=UPI003CC7850C